MIVSNKDIPIEKITMKGPLVDRLKDNKLSDKDLSNFISLLNKLKRYNKGVDVKIEF